MNTHIQYTEIFELKELLKNANVSFEFFDRGAEFRNKKIFEQFHEYWQIKISVKDKCFSIVQFFGSFGNLEIMWPSGEIERYKNAKDLFNELCSRGVHGH